jgi:F-type H+-transporting ATPase subunit b
MPARRLAVCQCAAWAIVAVALAALVLSPAGAAFGLAQEHAAEEPSAAAQEPAAAEHAEGAGEQEHAEEEHGEEHEGTTWMEYIQKWINFVMLLGVLYWLLVVPPAFVKENFEFEGLKVILAQRSESILAATALAKEQRDEATRRDTESAARLASIEDEAKALVATAHTDADADRVRIEGSAVGEAEKIRTMASRDLNAEVEKARRSLKTHVASLAVSIATGLLRENISDDDQDRMIRDYLNRLGSSVA